VYVAVCASLSDGLCGDFVRVRGIFQKSRLISASQM